MDISQVVAGALCGGAVTASIALVKHFVFAQPKVRLRAFVDARSVAGFDPEIEFKLTNVKDIEVNLSAIQVVRRSNDGESESARLTTKPHTEPQFRLPGLEQLTFEAGWEDIFPHGVGVDDVTEIYVQNIATEKRSPLPKKDLIAIREGVRETMAHRRDRTKWTLTCRSCTTTTHWYARRPAKDLSYAGGFPEHLGWTAIDRHPCLTDGDALCPGCAREQAAGAAAE